MISSTADMPSNQCGIGWNQPEN